MNQVINKIKQIMPVHDGLTAMIQVSDHGKYSENSKYSYVDAENDGWTVLLALVDDDDGGHVGIYSIDPFGAGDLDYPHVRFVPTMRCGNCEGRMRAYSQGNFAPVEYICRCGARFTIDNAPSNCARPDE